MRGSHFFLIWCAVLAPLTMIAQADRAPAPAHSLVVVRSVAVRSEPAKNFPLPFQCDGRGNAYLLDGNGEGTPPFEVREFSREGKSGALFSTSTIPEFRAQLAAYFSVADDGAVYQIVFPSKDKARYIVVFNSDGTFRRKVELKTAFPWMPSQVASFPAGRLLVAGMRDEFDKEGHYANMVPFTGIFGSDGTLLKTVGLPDDEDTAKRAEAGDIDIVEPTYPHHIKSIIRGSALAASDGNIYLMRRFSPAVFYAISPEGEVVRTFQVGADHLGAVAFTAHVSANRLAVQFIDFEKNQISFDIYDFKGSKLQTYSAPEQPNSAFGFVCYSADGNQFTFLGPAGDDASLSFEVAVPK